MNLQMPMGDSMAPLKAQVCTVLFSLLFESVLAGEVTGESTNQMIRQVGPGEFAMGNLKFDKKRRTVTFPITLNQAQGSMEYLLVTSHGKIHESIFRTDTKPEEIHIAMLLLGATGAGTNSIPGSVEGPISNPSKEIIHGNPVALSVKWMLNGKEVERPAEQLIFNEQTRSTPQPGNWVYNGSVVWQGKFMAQLEGSISSLITDQTALINNIASGHDNDQVWTVNTNSLPPADLELKMTIRLEERSKGE
ncbi:MAG: hypothetical protein JWM99_4737 [Verrucomicrobiales bacterium]|nr:hypothetical protein [Verrucomicrobiales bacterium]